MPGGRPLRKAYLAAAAAAVVAAAVGYVVLPASDTRDTPEPVEMGTSELAGTGPTDLAGLPVVSASEIESAVIPQEIADSNNGFAADFYRQVSGEEGNIFFSPLGMYAAFSMLYEGAGGEGAKELEDAFGFEPDARARHNMTAHVMASINRDNPHAELVMANALWPFVGEISPGYLDVGRSTYLATIENPGEDPIDRINGWVSDATNEKIPEVIDELNPYTVLVITNAIYFKGAWVKPFAPEYTQENEWHGPSGGSAEYMYAKDRFSYAEYDGLQVLRMPYEGDRLSMVVLLPEPGGMRELEESLSAGQMREWTGGLSERDVDVLLPKFTASTRYDLKEHLLNLGVNHIFKEGALNGITLFAFVSDAVHVAFVDVNEEGAEAAAVTRIDGVVESGIMSNRFVADRPFLFLIQDDESGTILFMGRVSEP
ncbi:serine protease inhibitor [Cenarchaeum symbiosum A]|uniref:Serine protease inhibitor n=1 Tax=Cenarchaeum symbiosum (strain A) TaxID=414004 RepID=A0RWY5_CENSY|nr:serine protease inhibitor [Cenarchaeum symbiosum A]